MAGNYPDVPGPRIAYDRDGGVAFLVRSGDVIEQLSADATRRLADDSDSVGVDFYPNVGRFGVILPVLHDLVGIFLGCSSSTFLVEVSPNTTSGLDGTWTQVGPNPFPSPSGSPVNQRSSIQSVAANGVKGVRVTQTGGPFYPMAQTLHLYGTPSSAPDRLRIWHPTLDQEVGGAYFDWGNVPRGAVLQRQFRVKNGRSLTAQGVSVSVEALTEASPPVVPMYAFSLDGTTWSPNLALGNLGPGATSAVVTVRLACDPAAQLGLWAQRIVATATGWS
jgi:hypothetical protein